MPQFAREAERRILEDLPFVDEVLFVRVVAASISGRGVRRGLARALGGRLLTTASHQAVTGADAAPRKRLFKAS